MLATLGDIKTRLGITSADTSQDGDLEGVLSAASDKILDVCRYSETNETGVVETLRQVQQGREYTTGLRNVTSATFTVEGRGQGAGFSTLAADLIDAADGVWMILGSQNWWPPTYAAERRTQKFRRWREPIWPVVRVTYDVTGVGPEAPNALREAALQLAIFRLGQSKAGAVTKVTIGQLAQEVSDEPLPKAVRSILGKHYCGSGATWVR